MALLGQDYQAKVLNPNSALAGIAQVRVGLPSMRTFNTAAGSTAAIVKTAQAVGKSTIFTDPTDGTTEVIAPTLPYAPNAASGLPIGGAAYTGAVDGCIIIRVLTASTGVAYGTDGSKVSLAALAPLSATVQGVALSGSITGAALGDTFVIPVYAAVATPMDQTQTNIVSPYSMFRGSNESVGGLTDAEFVPKIESMATMESGFPSEIDMSLITKVGATIKFTSQEFTNTSLEWLRAMVSKAVNGGQLAAIPIEVVVRTVGGSLYTYWCPNCTLTNLPSIAPKNDFSTMTYEFKVTAPVPGLAAGTQAAWLRNASLYNECNYIH